MVGDSKSKSWSEKILDTTVGYVINYFANFAILPLFVWAIVNSDPVGMALMSLCYTAISLARGYILRRVFNRFGPNENLYTLSLRLWRKVRPVNVPVN